MAPVLDEDVAWIRRGTTKGMTVLSAIPSGFEAYGLLDIDDDARRTDDTLLTALAPEPDHLLIAGWIVRGAWMTEPGDEHILYAGWRYRCRHVTARELLARSADSDNEFPDLLYPRDHRWIVSTLWDDSWRSIGSTAAQARQLQALLPAFERIAPDTDISTTGRTVR